MNEKLYEFGFDIDLTGLDDAAEEDLQDGINAIEFSDADNPFEIISYLHAEIDAMGNRRRYLYLDGFLTEGAYEELEDLLYTYGVRLK